MVSERLLHTRSRYLVVLAVMVLFTAAGFLLAKRNILPAIVMFLFGSIAVVIMLRLYAGANQAVAYFFNALRNQDTTLQFPVTPENRSLSQLYESMNQLNQYFQDIRIQNEYNEKYYRTLIRHSATGLLVLNSDNEVELINKIACQYAGISSETTNPNLLRIRNQSFYDAVCNLHPGVDLVYKHILGNDYQVLSFRASLLRKNNRVVKLISIQDIRHELESKELESYRKLISVMTHEIMNLMSPLTSVSKVLHSLYFRNHKAIVLNDMNEDILKTTLHGLQVIDEQGGGLLNFIDNYRKISRIPQPDIHAIELAEWMEQLKIVYAEKMKLHQIALEMSHDRTITRIWADKKLLNQVMINLLNNAMDAVTENESDRKIRVEVITTHPQRMRIKVTNNGPHIPPELQEKIFVPFFTTKKNGSGIGLSICQEIMKLHKGSLMLVSTPGGDTSFILEI
jgi:two-component system, NtrC family, nitrogen regulation sensor histidine kinase NtrY